MISRNNPRPARAAAVLAGLLLAAVLLPAQTSVVMLWPNGAPGSGNWTQKEAEYTAANSGLRAVRNVVNPSIAVYLPSDDTAARTSVVIAPGGGFSHLSWDSEGTQAADWLRQRGVACFVLKYRLTDSGTDGRGAAAGNAGPGAAAPVTQAQIRAMAAADGLRAIEVVRQHAAEWHLDPAKVGIMGFSAGGYVAVQAALDHTAANRPAFVASIYACCEDAAQVKVPDDAPPAFFLHAYDDPVSASSPALFLAWKAANKPAELHTYAAGGHGFGIPNHGQPTDNWIERFGDWLRYQKLMK
jgi:acetyl esterase/lipase